MGRRPDSPELQAAKGFPGKRRTKTERQIERAEELAALISSSPSDGHLAPPAMLNDPRCAPALAVWRDYAPKLARLNLFGDLDRHTFAVFCVYCGEFAEAQKDILDKGFYRRVKTVSGDMMDRINPSVDRRDYAQKVMLEMAKRFGLTPIDQMALLSHQAASKLGGLFGGGRVPAQPNDAPSSAVAAEGRDVVGLLDGLDSPPPRQLQ